MGFPEPVARKLHRALGVEGEILVTWLEEERVERSLLRDELTRLHADMAAMEIRLGERMAAIELRLGERIGNVKSDLMKWSFVFWVGAVAAIAMLADVLGK